MLNGLGAGPNVASLTRCGDRARVRWKLPTIFKSVSRTSRRHDHPVAGDLSARLRCGVVDRRRWRRSSGRAFEDHDPVVLGVATAGRELDRRTVGLGGDEARGGPWTLTEQSDGMLGGTAMPLGGCGASAASGAGGGVLAAACRTTTRAGDDAAAPAAVDERQRDEDRARRARRCGELARSAQAVAGSRAAPVADDVARDEAAAEQPRPRSDLEPDRRTGDRRRAEALERDRAACARLLRPAGSAASGQARTSNTTQAAVAPLRRPGLQALLATA